MRSRKRHADFQRILELGPVSPKFEQVLLGNRHRQWCRNRLVEACARFVYLEANWARKWSGIPFDDLFTAGLSGVLIAIDRFDCNRSPRPRLLTYAYYLIRSEMAKEIGRQSPTLCIPSYTISALIGKKKASEERLQNTHDQVLRAVKYSENRIRAVDFLEEHYSRADRYFYEIESFSEKILQTVGDRKRKILEMRMGINGYPPSSLKEVGDSFGLTRERIRQIQDVAMKTLNRRFKKEYQEMMSSNSKGGGP